MSSINIDGLHPSAPEHDTRAGKDDNSNGQARFFDPTGRTTLKEFMAACNDFFSAEFAVEEDEEEQSLGWARELKDKSCPKLKPWRGFAEMQKLTFNMLYGALEPGACVFESKCVMECLWKFRSPRRPIGDETFLRFFIRDSVEKPVTSIMEELGKVKTVREVFGIGDSVEFMNHTEAITGFFEESDQNCVFRVDGEKRTLIYNSLEKLPHMLTAAHLRAGLHPMDIYEDVASRESMLASHGQTSRFQYHAKRLTACVLTDAYNQMIDDGLEYGLVTTGEVTVFLGIDWDDEPDTLYYHLAEIGPAVSANPMYDPHRTVVGQHLAFLLAAVGAPRERSEEDKKKATEGLKTWKADFAEIWRSIPKADRWAPPETLEVLRSGLEEAATSRDCWIWV